MSRAQRTLAIVLLFALAALFGMFLMGCSPGATSEFTPSTATARLYEKQEQPVTETKQKTIIRVIPKGMQNGRSTPP